MIGYLFHDILIGLKYNCITILDYCVIIIILFPSTWKEKGINGITMMREKI